MERQARRERRRERATLQYYDIDSIPHMLEEPPTARAKNAKEQIAAPSKDWALTAIAQLVALRLNVRRCLISLFDTKCQYIIAEATASLALRPTSKFKHDEGDELWLAGCAIDRSCGFCEHVLLPPRDALAATTPKTDKVASTLSAVQTTDLSIIPDLAEDERFKTRPYIFTYPYNRFYVGSPIRTAQGIDIGVLCIFDTAPRPEGLNEMQQEFIIDTAGAVMEFLESNRSRIDHRRNERMVRGIGSFVEGSSTLAGWWTNADTSSYDVHANDEGLLDVAQQRLAKQANINPISGHETLSLSGASEQSSTHTPSTYDGFDRTSHSTTHPRRDHAEGTATPQLSSKPAAQPVPLPLQVHHQAVQTIFAKAANIIRESMEVEGVIFLDAQVSSFGGLVHQTSHENTGFDGDTNNETLGTFSQSGYFSSNNQSLSSEDDPLCKILAYATSANSTINKSTNSEHYDMSESSLRLILSHFPTGIIFNFDDRGVPESSDSEDAQATVVPPNSVISPPPKRPRSPEKLERHRQWKMDDADAILKLAPTARSAVFFPLWDFDRRRWFSGAFAWSSQKRPFTTRGELSYLVAFGNTIMSQVARLDAFFVDKAKTDLLGSISHELRSPLHGVLGGVEMLTDTEIDPFQNDVLHTIEMCGKTLLDTMDHLLDFAKINSVSRDPVIMKQKLNRETERRADKSNNDDIQLGNQKPCVNAELDVLVEEVVDSMCAGQLFFSNVSDGPQKSLTHDMMRRDKPNVAIILDIEYATSHPANSAVIVQPKSWTFDIVPGGFRRILMSVFGNALKYTDKGSIRVSLYSSQKHEQSPEAGADDAATTTTEQVMLRITDTGRGISSNFLNDQMFLPFTQEDRLNPGTGLGLSIAQQIVSHLDGSMSVRSEVGIGTEFTVTLPLVPSQKRPKVQDNSEATNVPRSRDPEDHVNAAVGLRIALVGFSTPDVTLASGVDGNSPGSEGIRTLHQAGIESWSLPRAEIENICRAKLAMQVLPATTDNKQLSESFPRPELLLTTDEYLDQLINDLVEIRGQRTDYVIPPIVAVCPSIAVARMRARRHKREFVIVDFISQPCGPRKLADAFALSSTRWAESKSGEELIAMPPAHMDVVTKAGMTENLPLCHAPEHDPLISNEVSNSPSNLDGTQRQGGFLLVEDNPINMRILTSFMHKNQHTYDIAENGLLALETFREKHSKYSYILMDISMPVMTGLEASRQIRAFEKEKGLKPVVIIALTALASETVQQEAFASGMNLFLTKPIKLKEIGEIIKRTRRDSGSMA